MTPAVVYVVRRGVRLAGGRTGYEVVRCERTPCTGLVVLTRESVHTKAEDADDAAAIANGRLGAAEMEALS